ncbi:DnaJ family domain-containing protein [Halobacillus sp. B23F22_1]|uniref:DnaJ family domain-containing protein n=1 Tax=Halobacillus sp. B23F22_1 TaxID=3459514 RepID=UPI00373E9E39
MDFGHLIEEKIKQSIQQGDFDNLPGKGKPLPKDELAYVPDDMRNSYRILKNANMLPEEMQLKKEIVKLEELLAESEDSLEAGKRQLTEKKLRFNMLMERRKMQSNQVFQQYSGKVNRKLGW